MKSVFCSQCGQELPVTKKGMPKFSRIVNLIDPHECLPEIAELDWAPSPAPLPESGTQEFVQKLNELQPKPKFEPVDKRSSEHTKDTSAPNGVLNALRNI